MRILANDFTVAGVTVKNAEIQTNRPASISSGDGIDFIENGNLVVDVVGSINGIAQHLLLTNQGAFSINTSLTSFNLSGSFTIVGSALDGQALPVTVSIGSSGVAAPGKNCDAITHVQRLFGFEDVSLWRSTVAGLSSVPNPRTEGCFALGVAGSGYMPIEGSRFPSSAANKPSKMSVDLFIPTGQPNPSWLGALQSYLECPSANLFNAYIGQVELTGRPVGAYSTLTFNLPANVKSTLAGSFNDCSIKFALNVNQTGKAWTLDKLKFIK